MAAATDQLPNYLKDVIGLGVGQEGIDRANAIIEEGIDSNEDIANVYDNDGIKTLCSNVRKPGGTMDDPNWVPPVPLVALPLQE